MEDVAVASDIKTLTEFMICTEFGSISYCPLTPNSYHLVGDKAMFFVVVFLNFFDIYLFIASKLYIVGSRSKLHLNYTASDPAAVSGSLLTQRCNTQ